MSLDSLHKDLSHNKYQKYSQKNTLLKKIKDLVYKNTDIKVDVKLTDKNTLILSCESAGAASNILYQSDYLLKEIRDELEINVESIVVKVRN